jgi:hypothetical protein
LINILLDVIILIASYLVKPKMKLLNWVLLSDIYDNKIKKCSNCNTEIYRDVNGSRNITVIIR